MFKIPETLKQQLITQSQRELPNEACGYLAGTEQVALEVIPMTNADASPEHFSFLPEEQFRAVKTARTKGLQLNAVYHSHPASPARLSAEDLRLANDPKVVYIIISLAESEPVVKGFRVIDKTATEVSLQFIEGVTTRT